MDYRAVNGSATHDHYTPPRALLGPDGLPITSQRWGQDGYPLPHVVQMGAIIQSGFDVYWDRWDEARRHSRENSLAMEKDVTLQALLQERALATATLKWHVHVDDEKDPYQKALKDGMQRVLMATPHKSRMHLETLKGGLWYGRSANQRVYEWREISVPVVKAMPALPGGPPAAAGASSGGGLGPQGAAGGAGGLAGMLQGGGVPAAVTTSDERRRCMVVRKHQPVHGDSIFHKFDGTPVILTYSPEAESLSGARTTWTTAGSRATVLSGTWRERFVVYSHESKPAEFFDYEKAEAIHGAGLRDVAYWAWWMKTEYLEWFSTFFERFGMGLRLWYYEAGNNASYQEVFKVAQEASRRVNVLVPVYGGKTGKVYEGGMESIETPIQGADAIRVMLEYFDAQIERYFVGQSMSGGADSESGLGGTGRAKFAANCVPVEGSEILTVDGFKSPGEVGIGTDVLAYDAETDTCRWTPLLDKTFFPDQEVTRLFLDQDRFEAVCTPDHSWAVERTVYASQLKGERSEEMIVGPRGALRPAAQQRYLQKAFALRKWENIILAAPEGGRGPSILTPTEAAVLGWVVTDGTIHRRERKRVGTRYAIAITQSKEEYFDPIRQLAAAFAGKPVHEVISEPRARTFPANGRTYATKAQHCWNLPTEAGTDLLTKCGFRSRADLPQIVTRLSGPARRAMLEAMMMAEGCERGTFANTDEHILTAFEILCALEGKATGKRRTTPTCKVKAIKSGRLVYGLKLRREIAGTADVWCPTTRYGTWVMRQNGRVMITGNTKYQLVKYDAENLADCYTSDWVKPVQRWTYPECRDVPLEWRFNVPDPDNAEKLAGVQAAISFGVDFKKEEVRALTGMSDPQPGDDIVGGPAQLAAELAADVAAEEGGSPVSGPLEPPEPGSEDRGRVRDGPQGPRPAIGTQSPAPRNPTATVPVSRQLRRGDVERHAGEAGSSHGGGESFSGVGGGHELSKKANAATTKAHAASRQASSLGSPAAHKAAYHAHRTAADEHFTAADALGGLASGGGAGDMAARAQLRRVEAIAKEHEAHYAHHEGRAAAHLGSATGAAAAAPKPSGAREAALKDLERRYREDDRPIGLTETQWKALRHRATNPGASLADTAAAIGVKSKQSVQDALKRGQRRLDEYLERGPTGKLSAEEMLRRLDEGDRPPGLTDVQWNVMRHVHQNPTHELGEVAKLLGLGAGNRQAAHDALHAGWENARKFTEGPGARNVLEKEAAKDDLSYEEWEGMHEDHGFVQSPHERMIDFLADTLMRETENGTKDPDSARAKQIEADIRALGNEEASGPHEDRALKDARKRYGQERKKGSGRGGKSPARAAEGGVARHVRDDDGPDEVLWEAVRSVLPSARPAALPHFCGSVGGVGVFLVDGDAVKLTHDMDFVEGANDLELLERADGTTFVPPSQVWVDGLLRPRDWPFVAYHELHERRDMEGGMGYDEAHERANAGERALRQRAAKSQAPSASEDKDRNLLSRVVDLFARALGRERPPAKRRRSVERDAAGNIVGLVDEYAEAEVPYRRAEGGWVPGEEVGRHAEAGEVGQAHSSPAGWGSAETGSGGTYHEPKVGMTDAELRHAARRQPLPLPPGAEGIHASRLKAWHHVSRLWPDMASKVTRIGEYDPKTVPQGFVPPNAFVNPHTGVLAIKPGADLEGHSLWHELVHLEQKHRGIPMTSRQEAGPEVEDEAHQRGHQAKELLARFAAVMRAEGLE